MLSVLVPTPIRSACASSLVSWGHSFVFKNFLPKIKTGCIIVEINDTDYPSYSTTTTKPMVFGDINSPESNKSKMTITNLYRFLTKLLFGGDIGFSETYILGDFVVDNLTTLIKLFIDNRNNMDQLDSKWAIFKHGADRIFHILNNNTVAKSKENIRAHYDLSNDMFQLFLDPTMSYSCAVFDSPEQDLESAQMNKIRKLIDKANLKPHHHLLEIGSGWGALAIEAVRRTGCRVTTISLSIEQVNLAKLRVKQAGLEDRIDVVLIDYRNVAGQFDRIISCEMLEAVGHEHYDEYFASLEKLLKPDGIVVLQYISFCDQRYETYRKSCDFIQKYIFPGGLCPSNTSLLESMTRSSQLMLEHLENFGPHYAMTLARWLQTFTNNREKILSTTGFDQQFIRMFTYYFCYCEAAFATRTINLIQMVLSRPCNLNLPIFNKDINQNTTTTIVSDDSDHADNANSSQVADRAC
ncbi:cyclopropane fatty acid synthase [Cavenderia fasciculata]|uniref:Cyclopropane fatty acid synthase n=1 Tax=Cavenderia fasciculata TaxID=261658 RepID=F4Q468_CACFS|nr:cyclopropane fatty acid synthase [Cavenderia fasciculata]EGG17770.1 cyclopropane fatty acid synthase [Cavenderia fasciculata]|eukprot:XP_004356254.1 cyclopropane fatty acid synthase [Cavenderia fasciculata]